MLDLLHYTKINLVGSLELNSKVQTHLFLHKWNFQTLINNNYKTS